MDQIVYLHIFSSFSTRATQILESILEETEVNQTTNISVPCLVALLQKPPKDSRSIEIYANSTQVNMSVCMFLTDRFPDSGMDTNCWGTEPPVFLLLLFLLLVAGDIRRRRVQQSGESSAAGRAACWTEQQHCVLHDPDARQCETRLLCH